MNLFINSSLSSTAHSLNVLFTASLILPFVIVFLRLILSNNLLVLFSKSILALGDKDSLILPLSLCLTKSILIISFTSKPNLSWLASKAWDSSPPLAKSSFIISKAISSAVALAKDSFLPLIGLPVESMNWPR